MKNIILLMILSLFFISCSSNNKEKKVDEQKKIEQEQIEQQQKSKYEKTVSELVAKYDITYKLNNLNYQFSIDYDSVLKTKYQLLEDIYISDFFMKDSIEYVSLFSISRSKGSIFHFEFQISKEQEKILREENTNFIFVVSVSEIKKIKFQLNEKGEDDINFSIGLGFNNSFNYKGNIITIVPLKK